MQFLGIPLQKVTWTLRTAQFTGQEIFTMGGEARFIQAVEIVIDQDDEGSSEVKQKTEIPKQKGKSDPKTFQGLRRIK